MTDYNPIATSTNQNDRVIVLDTESTGLDIYDVEGKLKNRLFEIGCVEVINGQLTGNNRHYFFDPTIEVEDGAEEVHGYSRADILIELKERKLGRIVFKDICEDFLSYIGNSPLVIHNAKFDVPFLDAELKNVNLPTFTQNKHRIFCTLNYANKRFPNKRNNLDALCDRLGVDKSERTLHGALIDAQLTAKVFVELTKNIPSLSFEKAHNENFAKTDIKLEEIHYTSVPDYVAQKIPVISN